ncbi:hypothetical protein [Bowmanella denitrificans]|uniref:hypothetical protein n=1 Tax=Bowmanella denitrificans TaxID=366582 RepID=UPI0031D0C9EB
MSSNRPAVAVLTTAFPVSTNIYFDYFDSLAKQSFQNFDIVLVNDGFQFLGDVEKKYGNLNIVEVAGTGNIAKNRELLINFSRSRYKVGVFADFDDCFAENRVACSLELLAETDIVVNDVDLFNESGIYSKNHFDELNEFGSKSYLKFDAVKQKNYFGMSNTAIDLSVVDSVIFPENLKAVDWYFFSRLMILGKKALFTNDTKTYYRQHDNNVANIGEKTLEQARRELEVKRLHYKLMMSDNPEFSSLYSMTCTLLESSDYILQDVVEKSVKLCPTRAWWSLINFEEIEDA